MGAQMQIFNLYRLTDGDYEYLLAAAIRRRYHNASQPDEDAAYDEVESNFERIIAEQRISLGFSDAKLVGIWEDPLPGSESFYTAPSTGAELDIWFTLESKYNRYMVVGDQDTELEFWQFVQELIDEGDLAGYENLARPPTKARVWFLPATG